MRHSCDADYANWIYQDLPFRPKRYMTATQIKAGHAIEWQNTFIDPGFSAAPGQPVDGAVGIDQSALIGKRYV
jgi:hypothetical protein